MLFKNTLEHYLGKLTEVPAIEPSEDFIRAFHEKTYSEDLIKITPIKVIENEIIGALDRGLPVSFGIHDYGNRLHTAKSSSHIFAGNVNPKLDGNAGHGMNIIGYSIKPTGNILYLIENSWGPEFGTRGTATISANYLYRQTKAYAIPSIQLPSGK